ncbi:hypothetical protein TNCV_4216681 [Trichonephila clavipes]|nr:hypothetical protein TNCV_4216681 [Trichonephila clavipes]
MFCPFAVPAGLGFLELLSLCRPRRSRHIPSLAPWAPMSGYTLYVSRRAVVTGIRGKRKHIVDASLCDAEDPAIKEKSGIFAMFVGKGQGVRSNWGEVTGFVTPSSESSGVT